MKAHNFIIWKYLDIKKGTLKALQDYPLMKKLKTSIQLTKDSDELREFKLKQINEYFNWFEPAWSLLDGNQQLILKEFYMQKSKKSGAGVRLQFEIPYCEREIHRKKDAAIEELSFLLFGK